MLLMHSRLPMIRHHCTGTVYPLYNGHHCTGTIKVESCSVIQRCPLCGGYFIQ